MTYELEFKKIALKEWRKLDPELRKMFKKKLVARLEKPRVKSAKLSGSENLYKIKLRKVGYRLVYLVEDRIVTVTVIAVGKRERNKVYVKALRRL